MPHMAKACRRPMDQDVWMRAGSTREGCLDEGWVDEGEMVVVAVQQALGLGHHRRRCRRLLLEDDLLSLQIYVPRPCICT